MKDSDPSPAPDAPTRPLIARALWHIESRLDQDLTLAGVAADLGTTGPHLTRSMAIVTGHTLMRHVWLRRLTRAAEALAHGQAQSVLQAALDARYASPEAFARAFRTAFGRSPGQITAPADLAGLPLLPAPLPGAAMQKTLAAPRIEVMPTRTFTGPSQVYDMQTRANIPAQWAAYNAADLTLAETVPEAWYGVCYDFGPQGQFGYLCGMELARAATLPKGWTTVKLPAGPVARFRCDGHISTMSAVWSEIYGAWLGTPGITPRDGPSIEFYPAEFNGETGEGGFEIWIPVTG